MRARLSITTWDDEHELRRLRRRWERNTWYALAAMLLVAAWRRDPAIGLGVALGGALGWVNYHWLIASTQSLFASVSSAGKASRRAVWLFALRVLVVWGTIGLILWSRALPVLAFVAGFCALVVALMLEAGYQIGRIILGRED